MKKSNSSESGVFNPRVFAALALCATAAFLAVASFADAPQAGTITPQTPTVDYDAGPFLQPNQSPLGLGQVDTGPRCDGLAFPCDNHNLTVTLPAGYAAANPFAGIKVTMSWKDTGSGNSDYDLYVFKNPRPQDCGDCTMTSGNEAADYQSASGANPEVTIIFPLVDGTSKYTIRINPFQPTGETVHVHMELVPGTGGPLAGFGSPDPSSPGVPRYQNFYAPANTSAQSGSGEFNIGFNPHTGRIMTMNSGPIWRITPPEVQKPAKPECCEGLWEDVSAATTSIGLDPILWTDQKSGRTFAANSTVGANAVYAYSDTDGDPTATAPTGWVEGGASPPNGGADHETIASGPYPAALSALGTPVNQGQAVYYCSQDIVGPAACQRSDTLGASYGPGVLAYNGQGTSSPGGTACGGLHGHLRVAPDGTAWLPVNQCGGKQGGAFSTDAGTTWHEFTIPGAISQTQGADASIAIDSESTIYYSYVNNEPVAAGKLPEGHARVVVGKLDVATNNITWSNNFDIGSSHGVLNSAEIEAIGGSSGRAAVGFLGTDTPGPYQDLDFTGTWYAFIATTYDGGKTWVTVNATPNDPVQRKTGIWQQGGGAQDRNLLDFNEMTVDDKGRALYGYSDGCVTEGCIAGTAANDFTAYMRVARQTGGKTLFASYDGNTDTTAAKLAKPPCLSGTRDSGGSHLTWVAPDNGGSDIVNYYIYRGTTSGGYNFLTPLAQSTNKTSYTDATADPNVPDYFYVVQAITALGNGASSNEVDLKLTPAVVIPHPECTLQGKLIISDKSPDASDMQPAHDVQSLSIGEPFALGDKLVFRLKVQSLATLPPNTEWPVQFDGPDGKHYLAQMTTAPADDPTNPTITTAPEFQVGIDGGTLVAADPASNYTADGTITIVFPRSSIGNPAIGTSLSNFLVRISVSGVVLNATPDNMPDNLTPAGSYQIVGNAVGCLPNAAPTAALTGTPDHGPAPLTVDFSAAASSDPDAGDSIVSYTFNFGDNSPEVTQASPTISHTYTAPGEYPARVTVRDMRGDANLNSAIFNVEVDALLQEISTRGNVQTGDDVMIGGFIINGTEARKVIVRGIIPTDKDGNTIPGSLADPTLELDDANNMTIATNDNWKTDDKTGQSQQTFVEGTQLAPTKDAESAIVMTLNPGRYTAVLRGKKDGVGLALVEVYDLSPFANSKLANISTRGLVGESNDILIGGFFAGPSNAAPMSVILRGIGPSLTQYGITNALPDPVIELRNSNGDRLKINDNWQDSQQTEIQNSGFAPESRNESAIFLDAIAPGGYTVLLSGNGGGGVGLVEIFSLE